MSLLIRCEQQEFQVRELLCDAQLRVWGFCEYRRYYASPCFRPECITRIRSAAGKKGFTIFTRVGPEPATANKRQSRCHKRRPSARLEAEGCWLAVLT